jgi:hypothetical protein
MSGWDFLDKMASTLPPILAVILIAAAGIIFLIGFSKHGINFIKYGFKQIALDSSLEKRFDAFEKRFDELKGDIGRLDAKIAAIETNHFGHLKNFLTELTSILLDKGVLTNQDKARLDNQLRGM